jgi:acyl carrier protein
MLCRVARLLNNVIIPGQESQVAAEIRHGLPGGVTRHILLNPGLPNRFSACLTPLPRSAVRAGRWSLAVAPRGAHGCGVGEKPIAVAPGEADDARLLAEVIRGLAAEVRSAVPAAAVRMDSRFAEDLGLDSLTLVELRSRVEEAFGVMLPDAVLTAAAPQQWLSAVRAARGSAGTATAAGPVTVPEPAVAAAHELPSGAQTLAEALAWHAAAHPGRAHIRLLHTMADESSAVDITYGELAAGASAVAAGLRQRGVRPGERVAIMLPTGREYFTAFMGTLLAGGVAVPVYPPARPSQLEEHVRRHAVILGNAQARVLVTVPEARVVARLLRAQVPSLREMATATQLQEEGATSRGGLPTVGADDTALLQYTSGSTGDPKGVILSHRHLLANIRAMVAAAGAGPSDVFVSWLPLYHDMGLIGVWLAGLYDGFVLAVMSPLAFLARPARWLRAISGQRATLSAAPNFAYELCLRQIGDRDLAGVDLSRWRLAFDGSEAVSAATVRRFTERFAPYGLRPEAMTPAYGLAEAGVAVTFPPPGRGPLVDTIGRGILARKGRAVPTAAGEQTALEVVSCGRPLPGYRLRVLDTAGRELAERREGRIEFAGPSATPGYFRNEAATAALCHGAWRDTGDLGYLANGELYMTGRAKDVIIRGGRNLHPGELEEAAGRLDGVEPHGVAVFGAADPALGTERLVVVAETRLRDHQALAALREAITAATVDELATPPDEVVLTAAGSVPKTPSGKIRRAATRERYLDGTLGRPARGVRRQVARLTLSAARARLSRAARSAAARLYAGYAWAATVVVGAVVWLLVATLPTLRARWAVLRAAGRLLRRITGVPLTVGGDAAGAPRPFIAVANHASFIDGLILVLSLPGPVCFAAGGKFATQRIAGPFLRRIGCQFVHHDPQRAAADTHHLADVLRSGRSLAVWPEGALDPALGVRPFHLGAFEAAATTGTPILPIGIRGSRDVVRPGGKLPRRHAVHVAIGAPIKPSGLDWPAVLALRDQARAAVAALCAEPKVG